MCSPVVYKNRCFIFPNPCSCSPCLGNPFQVAQIPWVSFLYCQQGSKSKECVDISACVQGVCLENLDAALPFLMLQSSLFLPVDQLLPETQPSTIPSHTLNFVAVLFYVFYVFFCLYIFYYILVQKNQQQDCYQTSICLHTTMEKKTRH